jgi:hypothetical protein
MGCKAQIDQLISEMRSADGVMDTIASFDLEQARAILTGWESAAERSDNPETALAGYGAAVIMFLPGILAAIKRLEQHRDELARERFIQNLSTGS